MFYFFLGVFLFSMIYNFQLLNNLFFNGAGFNGDFIFALICLFFALLLVLGTLRIKHLNSERIIKASKIIRIVGVVILIGSVFTFNIKGIVTGFEFCLIFLAASGLIYLYNTMPEGEPDVMNENAEFYDITEGYFTSEDDLTSDDFEVGAAEGLFIDSGPVETVGLLSEILELDSIDKKEVFKNHLQQSVYYLNEILMFGYEVRPEFIEGLNTICTAYLNISKDNKTKYVEEITEIEDAFDNIEKALENSYHNMKGAQAYKRERDAMELSESLKRKNIV